VQLRTVRAPRIALRCLGLFGLSGGDTVPA
jgi:hypothetical protein